MHRNVIKYVRNFDAYKNRSGKREFIAPVGDIA
jgi:hypothetical protein